jgi:hypothetical protein
VAFPLFLLWVTPWPLTARNGTEELALTGSQWIATDLFVSQNFASLSGSQLLRHLLVGDLLLKLGFEDCKSTSGQGSDSCGQTSENAELAEAGRVLECA